MSEAVISALITGICAVVGALITQVMISKRSNADLYARLDKQSDMSDARLDAKLERHMAVTDTKIDELTREVREHNGFARRVPVLEEQIKVANHRINDLEAERHKEA